MRSMSALRILKLNAGHRLYNAPVLGEFDAVIVDDRASSILDSFDHLQPGRMIDTEVQVASELAGHLGRRRGELLDMLRAGGILVVRLREPSALRCFVKGALAIYSEPELVWMWDWWAPLIERFEVLKTVNGLPVIGGSGNRVSVDDPDHCLEPYLLSASYAAVLSDLVFTDRSTRPRRLASNPASTAVACEFSVSSGLVILVPADGDEQVLTECVENLLLVRGAEARDWPVPEEQDLLDAYAATAERLRRERVTLLDGLREVRKRKETALAIPEVRRVLSRHRKATAASTSVRDSLVILYKVVEIIEDYFGGESAMIVTLGITKAMVNAVKKPANDKRYEVRHATIGEPEILKDDEVQGALAAARAIIQAFIDHLYQGTAAQAAP
jgi:hypothetical protein